MYLKELKISGFKSFAYPTKIEFTEDISAIIGPNGSGKSNISDAIRFVLGEQRTKLMRSQNMQDIIFSGTDSENARGVAHVQLILSNEEEPDLIIERKYYRTGDSEYLLNGKKVRLKDIQAEFLDTGLGKNGYSIISQGGVESIIGANPNELRSLVEEAVGIAGYKVQQNETLRRLESVENNIDRVSDILEEMEKQLRPLKIQADKTRQYLKIFNTLKDIDLVNFFDQEKSYKAELEDLNNNLISSNFSIIDLDKLAEEKDKIYLQIKLERSETEKKIQKLKRKIEIKKKKEIDQENIKNTLSKELENSKSIINEFKIRNEEINKIIYKDSQNKKLLKEELKDKQKEYQKLLSHLQKEEKKLNQLKKDLKSFKRTHNPKELEDLKKKVEVLTTEKIKIEVKLNQEKSQKANNEKKISEFDNEKESIRNKKISLKKIQEEIQINIEKQNQNINQLETTFNNKVKKLRTYEQKLQEINRNLDFEINLKNNYVGFREAVRSVMNFVRSNNITGVFGTVSDLFSTSEEYETAIQIALGNSLQNIVVKDSNRAKELINYLKENRRGRATFLPLDFKQNFHLNQDKNILSYSGVIDFANKLIKTDQKFKGIFNRLLGRIVIFSNYQDAQKFRQKNKNYTLVTLEGECFYSSGAIVGGSINKQTFQLTNNNRKINSLKKNKERIEEFVNVLIEETEQTSNSLKVEKENFEKLKLSLQETEKELFQLENQESLIKHSEETLESNFPQLELLQEELKVKSEKLNKLQKEITLAQEDSNTLNNKLDEIQEQLFQQQAIVSESKINEKTVSKEIESLTNQINKFQEQINQNLNTININRKEITWTQKKYTKCYMEFESIKQENKDLHNVIISFNNELKNQEFHLSSLNNSWTQIEEEIKNINREKITEVESKSKLERRIDKIKLKRKNLGENIFERYNLNLPMIENEIESIRKRKKDLSSSEINDLRQELKEIGSVNLNALDDYKKLKERYDELKQNYDDLIESKADIEITIKILNTTMSKKFEEKFKELNSLFSKVFSVLFEGGDARLEYQMPEDILNSGIQLFAQPPGKHLKNISLLSGGEKAMTAIALLLTFIQLNPTPFVIIDEIDAALDDNNINRFSRYLQGVKEGNQFIIITHRKGTIQICNNIHGISMNKDGISRCCSFEISDYLEQE